jgi:hypothetical protein
MPPGLVAGFFRRLSGIKRYTGSLRPAIPVTSPRSPFFGSSGWNTKGG